MVGRLKKSAIPRHARRLAKLFADSGHEVRIVGGWVRDTLRGIDPKDLDLATTATPSQMVDICQTHDLRHIPTGMDHGTITILPTLKSKSGQKAITDDWKRAKMQPDMVPAFEVTTLRVDTETDGRHAKVEFTTDWRKDAERRDFTINAMSVGPDGQLFDYFDGHQHLQDKRVIFVGDAEARIREDYLRILRFFRFRSRLADQTYDRQILNVIAQNVAGLEQISVERIWSEMSKILSGDPAMLCVLLIDMMQTGVLAKIGLGDVERYDIVHATIARDQTANPLTVLAAMTRTAIGPAWKMSRDEMDMLEFLQRHRRIPRPELSFFKDVAYDRGYDYAVEVASLFGPSDVLEATRAWTPVSMPVTGQDLLDHGYIPGPLVGAKLKELVQVWKDSDYRMDRDALLALV
jgi:tRNA nucleotidyltransferase (CCA-adding enzyme)